MRVTPAERDRRIGEPFTFEARDGVQGVLAALSPAVGHDIVGWPSSPATPTSGARTSGSTWPRSSSELTTA